jgi:hypothetical protein
VPHRPDHERINEARRAAIRNVLIDEDGIAPDVADAWIAAWQAEAAALPIDPGSDLLDSQPRVDPSTKSTP